LLSKIKRGKTPSIDRVEKLAAYLGCTVSELIGEAPRASGAPAASPEEDPLVAEIMARVRELTPDQQRLYLAQLRVLQDQGKK
jgi:transcriptional regulator with XRE-family HTH domain